MARESVDQLMDQGYALLADGKYKEARRAATKLYKLRHSSAFEIDARALWGLGRREDAIAALQTGVAKAPGASLLWHWLGCYQSDLGHFEDALAFFEREASVVGQDSLGNRYNVVLVHLRQRRWTDALTVMNSVDLEHDLDGPPIALWYNARAQCEFNLGRNETAIAAADACIGWGIPLLVSDEEEREHLSIPAILASAYGVKALAELALGRCETALENARRSIELDPFADGGWEALRQVRNESSEYAKCYHLMITGILVEDSDHFGFFTNFEVIADDIDEALSFIRQAPLDRMIKDIRTEEVIDVIDRPRELKSVLRQRTGYILFPEERGE